MAPMFFGRSRVRQGVHESAEPEPARHGEAEETQTIAGPGCGQTTVVDPVCRMHVTPETAPARLAFGETTYYFCSMGCARAFAERPHLYAGEASGR